MRRLLFVDDEPRILAGLRRMLHGLRSEWEMVFAEGGAEALACCAFTPFDVVVSDARMPGMEGSELLQEIMRLYPDTVRIMLSGQCSRDSVLRSVGVAHQFLSKPCDPQSLKSTVSRVCGMRERFPDAAARKVVSCVQKLPSQAVAYTELADQVRSAEACIEGVANIIASDVAMYAKTVQMVSSGFFGTPQRVMDATQPARLLGLETIKALLDSSAAFVAGESAGYRDEDLRQLNDHSLAVAACAKQIAQTVTDDRTLISDAYLSGMLHDIGDLALLGSPFRRPLGPNTVEIDQASAAWQGIEPSSSEACPDAGGYLAALWGLPHPVVQAIGYHQAPSNCPDQTLGPLTAVHVAHAFLGQPNVLLISEDHLLDLEYLKRTNYAGRLAAWREICDAYRSQGVLQ